MTQEPPSWTPPPPPPPPYGATGGPDAPPPYGPPGAYGAPPAYGPPPGGPGEGRRRRTGLIVGLVVGVLIVIAAAVAIPVVLNRNDSDEAKDIGTSADPSAPGPSASAGSTNLDDVQKYTIAHRDHVTSPVTYPQSPPVGGDHYPIWMDCGTYTQPINDMNAVHDLEHGTVWITYTPGLDAAGIATLTAALPENGILSPYPDQPAPVIVTVWGRQLALTGPDDPRLALFVKTFAGGVTAPEPMASCAGGLTDPAGGTS